MSSTIVIIGVNTINISDIRQHLLNNGVDMDECTIERFLRAMIEEPLNEKERREAAIMTLSALKRCPEPVNYNDVFKKDIQPLFKFNNVRKIRK